MKILGINVKGLKLFKNNEFKISFVTEQRTSDKNDKSVDKLFNNVYMNRILAFTGKNASGKTTALNIFDFIYNAYLLGSPMLNIPSGSSMIGKHFYIKVFFYDELNKKIYKLYSEIKKNEQKNEFDVAEEIISEKNVNSTVNKNNIFTKNFSQIVKRSELSDDAKSVLPSYTSIFRKITNSIGNPPMLFNLSQYNNFNFMINLESDDNEYSSVLRKILDYLDPTIETIKSSKKAEEGEYNSPTTYEIKFKNNEKPVQVTGIDIDKYLSSGTIKGLTLFNFIYVTLKSGGVLILDEIENHFHKSIVNTIIKIFRESNINLKHAILLFSTHYPELLDLFDRNDDIYVSIRENDGISIGRLSNLIKRNDLKRSEVLKSGFISGTAPTYKSMMGLVNELKNDVRNKLK